MEVNGTLVADLRSDPPANFTGEGSGAVSNSRSGFFARLFKRKVCLHVSGHCPPTDLSDIAEKDEIFHGLCVNKLFLSDTRRAK